MVLKSDQEHASLDVLKKIVSRRSASSKVEPIDEEKVGDVGAISHYASGAQSGRNTPESSPVRSSGSNGFIERGIQAVEARGVR